VKVNIQDAAYKTVHDYPGGSESLAPRLGMSPAVLRNKVNTNNTTHHLTLAEAERMVDLTSNESILRAWAESRGAVLVAMPHASISDQAVMELMARAWESHGDVGAEISKALADGRIDRKELARVKDRIFCHARVLFELFGRLESISED
jgi:hypothetical protein